MFCASTRHARFIRFQVSLPQRCAPAPGRFNFEALAAGYAPGVTLMTGCPCRVLLAGCFLLAELRDGDCNMSLVFAAGCLM